jgi:hypothetical protein
VARISHAARASGQQRAALANAAAQGGPRPASLSEPPGEPRLVRGQSVDAPRAW